MICVCGNCEKRDHYGDELLGGCMLDPTLRTHDYDSCVDWEPSECVVTAQGAIVRMHEARVEEVDA